MIFEPLITWLLYIDFTSCMHIATLWLFSLFSFCACIVYYVLCISTNALVNKDQYISVNQSIKFISGNKAHVYLLTYLHTL